MRSCQKTGRQKKDKRAIIECVYYLMLSSRMRTRKRGRPCIFQHCLMNCRAFCAHTQRHNDTHTHTHHFVLVWLWYWFKDFGFHCFRVETESFSFFSLELPAFNLFNHRNQKRLNCKVFYYEDELYYKYRLH